MLEAVGSDLLRAGARLAGHATLTDVRAFKLDAECKVVPDGDQRLGFDFDFNVYDAEITDGKFTAACGCAVELYLVGDDESLLEPRTDLGEIHVVFGALYEVREPDSGPFTADEVHAFSETSVRMTVYPYARALVADLTARLGLPHLTLPPVKIALPAPSSPGDTG